jgi:Co/Zn/Cd efflux system component
MRYLVAIICAVLGAFVTTLFIASPVATMIVGTQRFSDPDSVASMHAALFMAVNALGLLVGWAVGWLIGGRIASHEVPPA